jgi:hypothetical protein
LVSLSRRISSISGKRAETDTDEVPEPPVSLISRDGDLWICGEHRVPGSEATIGALDPQRMPERSTFQQQR